MLHWIQPAIVVTIVSTMSIVTIVSIYIQSHDTCHGTKFDDKLYSIPTNTVKRLCHTRHCDVCVQSPQV